MSDPLDDVFSEDTLIDADAEIVAEEVVQPVEAEPGTVELPQGTVVDDAAIHEAEARQVPLSAILDERDKKREEQAMRKAAEAERDRYKQMYEQTQQRPQSQAPDPYDDSQGFAAYQEQQIHQAVTAQKFQFSEMMAKQTHGEEVVETASKWALDKAQSDPTFAAAYHKQSHPIDWIVQQHKRDSLMSQLPTDVSSLDELIEREIAKRTASVAATSVAVPQQASPPVKVPRSLATQGEGPSDIRQVATGPTAAVDALFQ